MLEGGAARAASLGGARRMLHCNTNTNQPTWWTGWWLQQSGFCVLERVSSVLLVVRIEVFNLYLFDRAIELERSLVVVDLRDR